MFLAIQPPASEDVISASRAHAATALSAVEALDAFRGRPVNPPAPSKAPEPAASIDLLKDLPNVPSTSPAPQPSGKEQALTAEEREVLRFTSTINGKVYVPFFPEDLMEDFRVSSGRFVDPVGRIIIKFTHAQDGPLKLSTKQRDVFSKWVRPSDISAVRVIYVTSLIRQSPKMIVDVSSRCIKQTVVPNCSFVSSLAISADFEKRFNKKIITNSIFPQKNGQPIINPFGLCKQSVSIFP
jgi:calpain-7